MFERFTDKARQVIVFAQEEAGRAGHAHVGTEHLLLGLLAEHEGVAAAALGRAGLTLGAARADVARLLGPRPLGSGDAAALRAIGIDLDQVRSAVEAVFGPGALVPAARCRQSRFRRRRGGEHDRGTPLTPRAKKALDLALRESLHHRHGFIGTEHVLLGLLREGEGLAVRVLAQRGVSPDRLRADVLSALGHVA